jgi:hypothetical protein
MKVLKGVYEEGVIERYTGYTDKMMYRHVKSCLDSMNKTTLVKEGRGRKAILVPKRMYIENPGVAKLNEISIKHYKKLMETPKKIEFRDYQNKIIVQGSKTLLLYNFLYLAMEVRTGKTLTSLGTAQLLKCKNVLFITKKKAISSIEDDFSLLRPDFNLTVINYESLHKIEDIKSFDMLICDESHSCFLGDTEVGGVKIKDIKVGSFQKSVNFIDNKIEYKKVLNVFKNELTEDLIKIKTNGKEFICTRSHKVRTQRGWVQAGEITTKDELFILQ